MPALTLSCCPIAHVRGRPLPWALRPVRGFSGAHRHQAPPPAGGLTLPRLPQAARAAGECCTPALRHITGLLDVCMLTFLVCVYVCLFVGIRQRVPVGVRSLITPPDGRPDQAVQGSVVAGKAVPKAQCSSLVRPAGAPS